MRVPRPNARTHAARYAELAAPTPAYPQRYTHRLALFCKKQKTHPLTLYQVKHLHSMKPSICLAAFEHVTVSRLTAGIGPECLGQLIGRPLQVAL